MEMERINDNTIRVTIGNDDLLERGITFLDLLGNQKQIEAFFYSILEEVDVEEQFQGSDSVTFQVLPNRDGLELFISKNVVSETSDEGTTGMQSDGFMDFLKNQIDSNTKGSKKVQGVQYVETEDTFDMVFATSDFESLILFAKHTESTGALTSVYQYKEEYYLQVSFLIDDNTDEDLKDQVAVFNEYLNISSVTPDILSEYGQMIIERDALSVLKDHFN